MFNRRMFYALSILKIGRSLAHQLAHRTNFSKPPPHTIVIGKESSTGGGTPAVAAQEERDLT
jgi:hypothetical protein